MKILAAVIVLSILALLGTWVKGDFFSSISELETLLHTEGEIAKEILKYVQKEEERLRKVRRFGRKFQKLYESASGNPEEFLSHPVHAFLLVKHLTTDWKNALALIDDSEKIVSDWMNVISNVDLKFPGDEDLRGAAMAVIRLQETYLLKTTDIASGKVGGTTEKWKLSAGDCFELGYQACEDEEFKFCYLWMKEALKKVETESIPTVEKLRILETLSLTGYMIGKVREAKQIAQKIREEHPNLPQAKEFLKMFDRFLIGVRPGKIDLDEDGKSSEFRSTDGKMFGNWFHVYEKLCRGEKYEGEKPRGPLHCRYTSRNNNFLLLQPVKEEELSLDPRIVQYHDVISDRDMDVLKQLAKPHLKRATVHNPSTGSSTTTKDRISKSTWLRDSDHSVVARSSRMMQAITGLSISSAESLHVINYGIGGHYEPHLDFAISRYSSTNRDTGNRIATFIYYLSDVEAGGYTVFPTIGVQVKPKKGSAAFWFNLRRSGNGDFNTMHAACPVLIGSKWVANKWFHEADNEFLRKCTLHKEE